MCSTLPVLPTNRSRCFSASRDDLPLVLDYRAFRPLEKLGDVVLVKKNPTAVPAVGNASSLVMSPQGDGRNAEIPRGLLSS